MPERLGLGQKGPERLAHEAGGVSKASDHPGRQRKQSTQDLHINGHSSSGFEMLSAQWCSGTQLTLIEGEKGHKRMTAVAGRGAGAVQRKVFGPEEGEG